MSKPTFTEISESVDIFVDQLKKKHDSDKVIMFLSGMVASLVTLTVAGDSKRNQQLLSKVLNIDLKE